MTTFNYDAKQAYRKALYDAVEAKSTARREIRVVYLVDDVEALEAKYLISLGYRPKNIHVCNFSIDVLYQIHQIVPDVNLHHGDLFDCVMHGQGPIDVVNADCCGSITPRLLLNLQALVKKLKRNYGTKILAVTVLRGHDAHPELLEMCKMCGGRTDFIVHQIQEIAPRATVIAKGDHHTANGKTVMEWVAVKMVWQ